MSSYIFHNATVLLAHQRLRAFVKSMQRKRGMTLVTALGYPAPPAPLRGTRVAVHHQAVDHRMFALARTAVEMLEGGGPVALPSGSRVRQGAGKFAVMGSIGLDLPGMVEYLRPGQEWITSIIRRGSPDPNYSDVIVPTTHFILRVGELALARAGRDETKQRKIEGFVMGMLCSVAVEVVTNPILRGMQAAVSPRDWDRFSPVTALAAADARMARDLLGAPGQADWEAWWPSESEVPSELFDALDQALREVYPLAAPPLGFADFAAGFTPGRRPDARDLRNAYTLFRHGNITVGRGWNAVDWWGYFSAVTLPPLIATIVGAALPRAHDFLRNDGDPDGRPVDSRGISEMLTSGYLFGIFTPFGTAMHLHAIIPGDWSPYFDSILLFTLRLIGAAVFAGFVAGDTDEASRWALFGALLSTDLYALIRGFIELGRGRRGPALLFFVQALPLIGVALVGVLAAILRAGRWELEDGEFWLVLAIALVVYWLGLGFLAGWLFSLTGGLTVFLREQRQGVPLLDALPTDASAAVPRGLARLFDDATLWREPRDARQPLANQRYPSGGRVLLKLRWTGEGELEANTRRNRVTFLAGDGTRTTVTMPDQSVTGAELKVLLEARMPGLEATVLDDPNPEVRFPAPDTFFDPGDDKATFPLHDEHADDFQPVGRTIETAYLLRHGPRVRLTSSFGQRGPSCSPLESFKLVPEAALHDLDGTALGLAADLASLLCMGASRHLRTGLAAQDTASPPAAVPLDPAHRVFRQWNLDERRVNEWRTLVHGGARSERYHPAGAPAGALRDEGLRPNVPDSPVPDGEALASDMGWIPLWRAWSRMASDPLQDSTVGVAPYTPPVRRGPGPAVPPRNQDLSDAIRFLFDLRA